MRIFVFILLLSLSSCSPNRVLYIQPNHALDLRYETELTDVRVKNKSLQAIEVKIKDKATKEITGGFGMSPLAKVNVTINDNQYLHFINNSSKKIPLKIMATEKETIKTSNTKKYINFTLSNTSAKSIPLIIPNVMNPNLSPFSNSGVDLAIGQEIFFKQNGKRHLLFKVNDDIKEGDKIDVPELLKSRRKSLSL